MDSPDAPPPPPMDPDEEEETTEENAEGIEDGESKLQKLSQKNLELGRRLSCFNRNTKTHLQCNCLSVLKDNVRYCQAVAEYQLMFRAKSSTEGKKILIEWMRSRTQRNFRIPFILHQEDDADYYTELRNALICSNSLMDLLDRSTNWWRSCAFHHRTMTIPEHKLEKSPTTKESSSTCMKMT